MKFKVLSLILIIVFAFTSIGAYAGPTELDKLKEEQAKLSKQLEATKKSMNQMQNAKKNVSKQIEELDLKLDLAENEMEQVEQQLTDLEGNIALTTRELERATDDAQNQKELLKKRVRVMYENGNTGYLAVILDSADFSDFISRLDFLKKIVSFDTELLGKMKDYKDTVEDKKNKLQTELDQKAKLKEDLGLKMDNVEMARKDKEKTLKDLSSDLKDLERQEDEILEQSAEIGRKIVALQSSSKYVGGKLGWPVPGYTKITSPFGYRMHPILKVYKGHTGIDIAVPSGTSVQAANSGTVIYSGYYGGYGYAVIIDHGGQISTLYAHNSKLLVKEGAKVEKGQVISKSGSTGLSTGPHLHFEVRLNGQPTDPIPYVTGK